MGFSRVWHRWPKGAVLAHMHRGASRTEPFGELHWNPKSFRRTHSDSGSHILAWTTLRHLSLGMVVPISFPSRVFFPCFQSNWGIIIGLISFSRKTQLLHFLRLTNTTRNGLKESVVLENRHRGPESHAVAIFIHEVEAAKSRDCLALFSYTQPSLSAILHRRLSHRSATETPSKTKEKSSKTLLQRFIGATIHWRRDKQANCDDPSSPNGEIVPP